MRTDEPAHDPAEQDGRTAVAATLADVHAVVDVPPVDAVAFTRRVRAERRRHGATRLGAVAAVAAVAAVVVGVGVVRPWDGADRAVPPTAVRPDSSDGRDDAEPALRGAGLPFLQQGSLWVLPPRGPAVDTRVESEALVGMSVAGPVVQTDGGRLLLVLQGGEKDGVGVPLADGEPVREAALSADGTALAWVGPDEVVHLRDVGADGEPGAEKLTEPLSQILAGGRSVPVAQRRLVAADAESVLMASGRDHFSLIRSDHDAGWGGRGVGLLERGEVRGGTVLAQRAGAASVLVLQRGGADGVSGPSERTFDGLAALSPTGESVAQVAEPADARRVEVVGLEDGDRTALPLAAGTGTVLALRWPTQTQVLLLTEQEGVRSLVRCALGTGCEVVHRDATGALSLAP